MFLPTDISEMQGKIHYLCEFETGVRFIESKVAKQEWPEMIIGYLEPMMEI